MGIEAFISSLANPNFAKKTCYSTKTPGITVGL